MDQESGDEVNRDDGSRPPPETSSRPRSNADWAVDTATGAKAVSKEALLIATEARDTGRRIEAMMGASPDPVRKIEGAGLLGGVAAVLERLEKIEADLARGAASRAWWASLGRGALVVLGAIATIVGLVKTVGGGR